MNDYADILVTLRERTGPRPRDVAAVRARLDRQLRSAHPELSRLPGPDDFAVARVRARLRGSRAPQRRPAPVWLGATLAFAAISAVVAGVLGTEWAPPVQVDVALTEPGQAQLGPEVLLRHDGAGQATRRGQDVFVTWDYGRLELDVAPDHGLNVVVTTPEGVARVVGTRFVVVRDAFGTEVAVEHGEVALTCGSEGPPASVVAGGRLSCDPLTAAGWLNRASTAAREGMPAEQILADVDRGLRMADAAGAVRGELLALRTDVLVETDRHAEALDSAELAIAATGDEGRGRSLRRLAARLALLAGDCARALPHLAQLPDLTETERAYRDRCQGR